MCIRATGEELRGCLYARLPCETMIIIEAEIMDLRRSGCDMEMGVRRRVENDVNKMSMYEILRTKMKLKRMLETYAKNIYIQF